MSAVEEYRHHRDDDGGILGPSWAVAFNGRYVSKELAYRAIAELEAENVRLEWQLNAMWLDPERDNYAGWFSYRQRLDRLWTERSAP